MSRTSLTRFLVEEQQAGRITALVAEGRSRLKDSAGRGLQPGWKGDSEGLAMAPDGRIWVSFEGLTRVTRLERPDAHAHVLPRPAAFERIEGAEHMVMIDRPRQFQQAVERFLR